MDLHSTAQASYSSNSQIDFGLSHAFVDPYEYKLLLRLFGVPIFLKVSSSAYLSFF